MRYHEIIVERANTASPDFRRWFGDSKVVDAASRPLVVYHGTGGDFAAFDTAGGKGKTFNTGSFFSSNPATASTYAGGEGGNLRPVYLSLQHPAVINAGKRNWNRIGKSARIDLPAVEVSDQADEDLLASLYDRTPNPNARKKLRARSTTLGRIFPEELRYVDDFSSTDDMARWAKTQGYDGLIIRNVADHGPSGLHSTSEARKPSDLYVAFRPEQIKSAISNSGAFDPRNPNILEDTPATQAPAMLYHATFQDRVSSIMKHGLGGIDAPKNFDASRKGVIYLSDDPDSAEAYAANSQFGSGEVVLLQIDVSRMDRSQLRADQNDEGEYGGTSYEYSGVIPPSAISLYDGFSR